ncbi:homocysteine S-methyltransferase family protein [bacterium]|nr:homocysteine S-methyltransferase family protein [candidate division CSSED10-310 bacterium]
MNINDLRQKLIQRIVIGDGGLGTLLQQRGLKAGHPPESMLLDCPEEVEAVHRLYIHAGADFVTTNSFGGSRPKLAQHGLENAFIEINRRAVFVARHAAGDSAYVAASIGPTGELLQPMGTLTMEELVGFFLDQVRVLNDAGADFAILETMGDIGELQAAARACFIEGLPFMASMTYDDRGRSLAGATPHVTVAAIEPYQPLAIGTNCGMGPDGMVARVEEYVRHTHVPVLAQPNAGLPELDHTGRTVFRLGPDAFAEKAVALVRAGASLVGGCCGTTPEHIVALRRAVDGERAIPRKADSSVRFAARSGVVEVGYGHPFRVVGERINPTGRKKLSQQLATGDFNQVKQDARAQVARKAHILDINVGVPGVDESTLMVQTIAEIQGVLPEIPVSIDSNHPDALIRGLRNVVGRPLLNSINGEENRLITLLPVVRETGANFIALAMDESGIPADAAARMAIIRRIIDRAEALGISRNRILVDCLVFTVGSQPHQARETLEAIRRVRKELGCATILGVSNVSFGLPNRAVLSSTFLAMALHAGLDAGIINPLSDRMMETLTAAELLLNRDPGARNYVALMEELSSREAVDAGSRPMHRTTGPATSDVPHTDGRSAGPSSPGSLAADADAPSAVYTMVIEGDKSGVITAIDSLLAHSVAPQDVLSRHLVPAIEEVGRRYGSGACYLPQLILAGETMRAGVARLRPMLAASPGEALHQTPCVLGTVSGDIHDIGKNIVAIVLENHGFKVIDLGKNVSREAFAEAVHAHRAPVAGLSALMTTTMPAMEETVKYLHETCPGIRVMVGGAVVNKRFSERIGADGYAREAVEAGSLAMQLIGK